MKRINIYTAVLLLFAACTADLSEKEVQKPLLGQNGSEFISTKVVNSPLGAVEGMLMVKTNQDGLFDLSGAQLPALNITSVKQAFHVTEANREKLARFGLDKWYVINFDRATSLKTAAKSVSECANVEMIQFNKKLTLHESRPVAMADYALPVPGEAVFNDPLLMYQWHYDNVGNTAIAPTVREGADVNVKDAWGLTAGDPDVIVAVLDRGVQHNHPDLAANMWVNERERDGIAGFDDDGNGLVDDIYGYNFVADGPITWDAEGDTGHGTHVAGTVAAVNNNGEGVCGIAGGSGKGDGVRIMSCQVFDGNLGGDVLTMARAMIYAADMGAAIAQGSFGFPSGTYTTDEEFKIYSYLEAYSLEYFMTYGGGTVLDGGLAIFAAGNDGGAYASYPGAYSECICVGAIGPDYLPASYTNYGYGTNIVAPGGDYEIASNVSAMILSTMPGGLYGFYEGTSMACPHVSGVAALGLSYAKKLGIKYNRVQFTNLLLSAVNDIDMQLDREKSGMKLYEYRGKLGVGLIDAWKLLMRIEGTPSIVVPVGKEVWVDLSPYMGASSQAHQSYVQVDADFTDKALKALGVESKPVIEHGKLKIKCGQTGSAKVRISFYIDYKVDSHGMPADIKKLTRELSIISRGVATSNGGWL